MAEAAGTRRLFVGIALSERTRAACEGAADALRATGFAARYEAPEKLHVTLAFLGNVDAPRSSTIGSALEGALEQTNAFAITLDKLAAFPHERKPRVVYLGSRNQGENFRSLSAAVRDALSALGFSFDDDAVAHVTIARVKEPRRPLPLVEFAPIELQIDAVSLFESIFDRARNTSRYEIVETTRLRS